jgi:PST family polysaccharide transporter
LARLVLRVVAIAVLARLLTPKQYGIAAGAQLTADFATMIYGLGLAPTLIQRTQVRREHVATAFWSSLAMAVLVAAGMWTAASEVAALLRMPALAEVVKVTAVFVPLGAFGMLCEALLARSMRSKSLAVRPLVSYAVATFFVAIPMAHYGYGYWSLVGMQAADTIMDAVILGFAARRLLVRPAFSGCAFRELFPLSLGFTLNQPLVYIAENTDKFLISRFLGANTLGLYSRASFMATTAASLFTDVTRLSVFPAMAQVKDDHLRLQKGLLKFLSVVAFVTLPISAFCIVFAKQFVVVLLGARWSSAALPFAVLSAGFYFRLTWRGFAALFQALGRPNWITGIHIFRAGALVVGIWWARTSGISAICAVVLAVMVLVVVMMVLVARFAIGLSLREVVTTHLHPLAFSAAIVGLGLAVRALMPNLPNLLLPLVTLFLLAVSSLVVVRHDKRLLFGASTVALFYRARADT